MNAPIANVAQIAAQIKANLLATFPDLAEDEQALMDTLEGLTDFNEVAEIIISSALNDEALAAALKARQADMAERCGRLEARSKAKRAAVAQAMEVVGIKKIEAPECTISLRNVTSKLVVTDEGQIPNDYWREKVVRSVDKDALKEALKTKTIPGAQMSNGGVGLTVRTK
jgi:hypothetical protein